MNWRPIHSPRNFDSGHPHRMPPQTVSDHHLLKVQTFDFQLTSSATNGTTSPSRNSVPLPTPSAMPDPIWPLPNKELLLSLMSSRPRINGINERTSVTSPSQLQLEHSLASPSPSLLSLLASAIWCTYTKRTRGLILKSAAFETTCKKNWTTLKLTYNVFESHRLLHLLLDLLLPSTIGPPITWTTRSKPAFRTSRGLPPRTETIFHFFIYLYASIFFFVHFAP